MIDFPKQKIVVAGAGRSLVICHFMLSVFFLVTDYFLFDVNLA